MICTAGPKHKCRRCGVVKGSHATDMRCADGRAFQPIRKSPNSASNSFSGDELMVLRQLLRAAVSGQDARVLARHAAYASLARKTSRMLERLARRQLEVA